ncbi:renalase isoform X2 [Lampris incognitus]|uniref:renalase isoform X2 n=1 Tax=Lampris incognitus TaxID=2546036 RepID=UPI0024B499B2|nr:renalase isoform X2 [Lampris incognitus]
MARVLIVGAGLTGSLCACLLRREMPDKVKLVVWDKARGSGGRMSTSRNPDNASSLVDLGAQYISASSYYAQSHRSFYEELLAHGVLEPLDAPVEGMLDKAGTINYVTPLGMSSIVKHFLKESGAELFFNRHVTSLFQKGASWEVHRKGGEWEEFDAVVLTMPVPQILQLQGDLGKLLSASQKELLETVSYSSRYALGLFYPPAAHIDVPWAVNYVANNACIRYIAIDDRKRSRESPDCGPSMVVHTSVPFGLQHLEQDKEAVQPLILEELNKLLPGLPQPRSVKCHKWRYSQVLASVPDCPGQMTLHAKPPLVCGGDGFIHSNFDGCVESALRVFDVLKASL